MSQIKRNGSAPDLSSLPETELFDLPREDENRVYERSLAKAEKRREKDYSDQRDPALLEAIDREVAEGAPDVLAAEISRIFRGREISFNQIYIDVLRAMMNKVTDMVTNRQKYEHIAAEVEPSNFIHLKQPSQPVRKLSETTAADESILDEMRKQAAEFSSEQKAAVSKVVGAIVDEIVEDVGDSLGYSIRTTDHIATSIEVSSMQLTPQEREDLDSLAALVDCIIQSDKAQRNGSSDT